MSQTAAVVDALKRALKARKLTYAEVAKTLKLSEASVKRMFAANHFTLERFEQVCQLAGIGLTDLAREVDSERNYISHLTLEQITEIYDIPKSECIQLLLRLDHIKFLELLPKNRIKLLVTRTFSWVPNGPILQYFKTRAAAEYFRSRFDAPGEFMMVINGMLSTASGSQVIARLRRIATEFSELHNDDMNLPLGARRPASIVLALRPWELDAFHVLRRKHKARAAA